jgi:tetratricopeptide (TPR) repeat protein
MSLNEDLEIYLREKLITRDISTGISRLARPPERTLLATLRPGMERSYSLLALHLLFIDAGASRPLNMSELLSPFDSSAIAADRATLMSDFALLRLALGIYSMVMGRFADAIGIFENLHWIPLTDPFYRIIRSYCLARCLSRSARYIEADNYYQEAIDQCRQNDFLTLGWVITANRAWPQLQLNHPAKARELLQDAQPHIPEFDHVTLANVHSTYARIFRRENEFYQALNEYRHADDILRTNQFIDHPSRARILIQWAVTERHIAMQDQEEKKRLEGIHHDADQEYRLLSGLLRTAEFKRLDPRLKRYNKLPGKQYLTTLKEILTESTSRADIGILNQRQELT